MPGDAGIAAGIRVLLAGRAAGASICPSEVARALWPEDRWREAMPDVRRVAAALARDGVIGITQAGRELDPDAAVSGPIRLRRGPHWPD